MLKSCSILILSLSLALLCSCGSTKLASETPSPAQSPAPTDTAPPDAPSDSPNPVGDAILPRAEIFRSFLSENYQTLSTGFSGGISGLGYLDLDLDGEIELLIFDAGASAAMGLQFFDVIDGTVECVSANMSAIGTAFGGDHLSEIFVNANSFEDFRLMQNKETGEHFFLIESGNGAVDFSYRELIRFGNSGGVLTLESLMYRYEEYDLETGTLTKTQLKLAGEPCDQAAYEAAHTQLYANLEETGYVARGALLWDGNTYGTGLEALLKMAERAQLLYLANSYFIT